MNPCVENISWDNPSGISMSLGLRGAPEFSRRLDWGWEAVNNPFMYPHPHEKQCDSEAEGEGSQAASFRKYNESLMGLSSHHEKTLGMLNSSGGIRSFGGFPSSSSSGFHGGLLYTDMPGFGFGVGGYDSGSSWVGITSVREQHGHKEGTVFSVKRDAEELKAARIGLNLGHRTYFSEADAAAAATVSGLFKRPRAMGGASKTPPRCQAEGCKADLSNAKHYHRRHKVCEFHSKAISVVTSGLQQRFCQQCSRFHGLSEFDETKRSCRKRLADHNRRRRKPPQANAVGPAAPLETPTPTPTPALLKAFNIKS